MHAIVAKESVPEAAVLERPRVLRALAEACPRGTVAVVVAAHAVHVVRRDAQAAADTAVA